jgi:ubiquinone/menaquinone biosynthesis C-methylase UbiE
MSSTEIEKLRPKVINLAKGIVLEIGAGSGLNLPIYKNISKLHALEPSQELTDMAKVRTKEVSFPVEFLNASAEHIPLPDKSVDTVVSTWTLCSIPKPEQALKEIIRVLRPEGFFAFIDHGVSPKSSVRSFQNLLTPITKHFTGNCHLNRDIEGLIKGAGFKIQNLEQFHEQGKPLVYNNMGIGIIE